MMVSLVLRKSTGKDLVGLVGIRYLCLDLSTVD